MSKYIDEKLKSFDEKFGDTEGCQAGSPECGKMVDGKFVCEYCQKWGGQEGVVKGHRRLLATHNIVKSFLKSALEGYENRKTEVGITCGCGTHHELTIQGDIVIGDTISLDYKGQSIN